MNKEPIEVWVEVSEVSATHYISDNHLRVPVKNQSKIILSQEEWDETEMNRMALDLSCETISQLTIKNQEKDKEIEILKTLLEGAVIRFKKFNEQLSEEFTKFKKENNIV